MKTKILNILKKTYSGKTMLASFQSNPYKVLISTILSVRNKDEVTIILSEELFKEYPTINDLAKADIKKVQRIIHSSGMYKQKAIRILESANIIVNEYNSVVPKNIDTLLTLPGVGRKVANCVLVYAYDIPAIPVDIHVHRISNRLGWVVTKDPEKTEVILEKEIPKKYWTLINEVFVLHGKSVCKPITPHCSQCPIENYCPKVNVNKYK